MVSIPGTTNFPTAIDDSTSLMGATNSASTTLSASASSGATTLTVVSTSLFPAAGAITIDSEIITYTSVTATTFAGCTRGAFGTSAAAHASGVAVVGDVYAAHHTATRDALIAVESAVGPWKLTTLTESSATGVADVAIASGAVVGGSFMYAIEANDGTDYQCRRGSVPFVGVNKAGTLTLTLGTPVEVVAVSSGTLTVTVTFVTGTNKGTLKLNAVSSLTQTTLRATSRVVIEGGAAGVTML